VQFSTCAFRKAFDESLCEVRDISLPERIEELRLGNFQPGCEKRFCLSAKNSRPAPTLCCFRADLLIGYDPVQNQRLREIGRFEILTERFSFYQNIKEKV